MTEKERVQRTLAHKSVDRFPRDLWYLDGVAANRAQELERIRERYPPDFARPPIRFGHSRYESGTPGRAGSYVDAFGSGWEASEDGVAGEVKRPALLDLNKLDSYQIPWEMLENADYSQASRFYESCDKYVIINSPVNPFERLQHLRGTQNLLLDLAEGEPRVERLLEMLHDFNCRCMAALAALDLDAVAFMDDWGTQKSLLISPVLWRRLFKPLYREYISILHGKGKKAFFHSDGFIEAIYPDLIEIGLDAINSQLFCMDIEGLVDRHGGSITFWGEMDRQRLLPFGTAAQVGAAADRVARAVIAKHGCRTGFIAQCEWGNLDPYDNVDALYRRWSQGQYPGNNQEVMS